MELDTESNVVDVLAEPSVIRCSILTCNKCIEKKMSDEVPCLIQGHRLLKQLSEFPAFNDVIGLENAKREVNNLIFNAKMNQVSPGSDYGGRNKNYILLVGVSGTGKSTMATAAAKRIVEETGANYFNIQPETITSRIKGVSTTQVLDDLFEEVRNRQPSVLVIEFLDALIPIHQRGTGRRASPESPTFLNEEDQLVSQFVSKLEQLQTEPNVFVMAITDQPFNLRPEGLRIFHNVVYCPPPGKAERTALLRIFLANHGLPLTDKEITSLGSRAKRFSRWDMISLVTDVSSQANEDSGTPTALDVYRGLQQEIGWRRGSITRKKVDKVVNCLKFSVDHRILGF